MCGRRTQELVGRTRAADTAWVTRIFPDEKTERPWAPCAAVVLTVLSLVPGVGLGFGVAAILTALYVVIRPRYTGRQKLVADLTLIVAIPASAFWVLILNTAFI
jgi:hypothetical protein